MVSPRRVVDFLGVEVDLEEGVLRIKRDRLWRVVLSGEALLQRGKVSGMVLRVWIGHVVNCMMLMRPGLAVLDRCYAFVSQHLETRSHLWPGVKAEIRLSCSLLFLAEINLKAEFCREVVVTDSSDTGYASRAALLKGIIPITMTIYPLLGGTYVSSWPQTEYGPSWLMFPPVPLVPDRI